MTYDLIIFDCDGVLVDSEALAARVWAEFLAEHGVIRSPEELGERYAGMTDAALGQRITEETGIALPPEVPRLIEERANGLFDRELQAIDGVAAFLANDAQLRCVCSNSGPKRLRRSLETTGLAVHFNPARIFSAALVAEPKPAPDLHLHAATSCGISPSRCVVIEDSATGVRAARAAGMDVLGFVGASHLGDAQATILRDAGATRIFHQMTELPALLAQPAAAD